MLPFKATLQALYEGDTDQAHRFRYALLAFDIATIAFVIVTSFLPLSPWIVACDVVLGLGVLADFLGRLAISRAPAREFLRLSTWTDVVAIASFLAPMVMQGVGFLRILRTLRLLRTYQLLDRLRQDSAFFQRNEEAILAATNLVVFVFVMTGVVYISQHGTNPAIGSPVDALYFTVTSLTTTGYGDITLPGTSGRLISVFVMICGVTLFFRLAQVVFRPYKVRFSCPTCGLQRHEPDAVHCKACGTTLNIPDEGAD
ncbi:potassium channel family protein [Methylobacterium terricola]|uniref:Potassium channel family protein n=1 Tax=Methylobacterium terricola TaxID=2583531 RepID=A0A5C4LIE9_9HYPH|nr:potassium channel family protein [Methylobacterium terricola]TNC12684.1 potassium channel family protein [Methylobacterium terricola]